MSYAANVVGSQIDITNIRALFVQGNTAAPTIVFALDPTLTGLNWIVRGTFVEANVATLSGTLTKTEGQSAVSVTWPVGSNFTTNYGELQLVLVGSDTLGTIVTKAVGLVNVQRDLSISTVDPVDENLIEQLMAQSADKAYVDAAIGDIDHNDLDGLQGGSAAERYHMTSAQHTVIGNTSGTNTGDQDVSGAISTHNTDAGAHANLQIVDAGGYYDATTVEGALQEVGIAPRGEAGKKYKVIAGTLRTTSLVHKRWTFLDDANHTGCNITAVNPNSDGTVELTYGFTASKIVPLVVVPHRSASRYGFVSSCPQVGLSSA